MNYDRIILELMERIQILEARVGDLEKKSAGDDFEYCENVSISSKYRGLTEYLLNSNGGKVSLTYPEIEDIIGFKLPDSAYAHMRAYWSNTETHSYAKSWLAIGYRTRVDIEKKIIHFEKKLQI